MAEASSRQIKSLITDELEAGAEVEEVEDGVEWEAGEEVVTTAVCPR